MTFKTIKLKKTRTDIPKENDREVKAAIIFIALFAGAMIIGAALGKSNFENKEIIKNLFNYYISQRASNSALNNFSEFFLYNSLIVLFVFTSGFSCIGLTVIGLITILKGIGLGMISGYLFSQYTISGIGYYLLTILPANIIIVSGLILSCLSAFDMSTKILALVTGKGIENNEHLIKNYLSKFALIFIIIVAGTLINTLLTNAFAHLFVI